MGKRIALTDYIEIDGVPLSNFVRAVGFTSTDERVDASGFNAAGSSEFLLGTNVREVTLDVIMGRGTDEPHGLLWYLHHNRLSFSFVWRSDYNSGVSATNPELRGMCLLPEYGEGATRGELEVTSITLIQADETAPLTFYNT